MNDTGAEYVKQTLTGAEYVRQITSVESDRRARSAFHDLVLRVVPPGGALFDFGAGAGIDAHFFAERGFTVEAYDVDPRMRQFFAEHCRDFMDSGRVALDCSSYREFVTSRPSGAGPRADAVISDFAPLNLVADLNELFAKFHALTGPNGKVIVSVLSPYFIDDMKFRWWWRNAARMWRAGYFFLPGPQAPHFRRRLANFASLSMPYYRLARLFRGLPPLLGRHGKGVEVGDRIGFAWLRATTSRFMFLEFEKCDPQAAVSGNIDQASKGL
jgi:SAM-dependent methyltransferase